MKFELSEKDQKRLKNEVEKNPVRRYLMAKDQLNFEVGDVLIKLNARYNYNNQTYDSWQAEPISSSNKMAQRYVCIFKDEFGIAYMKQLKVSTGKLGEDIFCVSDYDYTHVRFEVDPEYAEKTFLDADFNIKEIHNASLEARKIITKMNRKTGVKPKTLKEANSFFVGLGVGDKFWVTQDYTARWCQEYEVTKIETISTTQLERDSDWNWRHYKDRHTDRHSGKSTIDDVNVVKVYYKESNRDRSCLSFDFGRDNVFFKEKPQQEK